MPLDIETTQTSIVQSLEHNGKAQKGIEDRLKALKDERARLMLAKKATEALQQNYERFSENASSYEDGLLKRIFSLAKHYLEQIANGSIEDIIEFTDNGTNNQIVDTSEMTPLGMSFARLAFQTHRNTLLPSIVVIQPTEDPDVFQSQELQLTELRAYTGSRNYFYTGEEIDEYMKLRGNHEISYPDFRSSIGLSGNTSLENEIPEEYDLFLEAVNALEVHYSQNPE